MAYQLFFTSVPRGLSDHSGFQFVAVTSGTAPEMKVAARRHLEYQPPRSGPGELTPAEVANFPVAFGYSLSPAGAILSLCRYLGTDFTGRPGNFLGIAVIADPAELSGALPIEMWRAPWWPEQIPQAAPTDAMPQLTDLEPGHEVSPEAVVSLLRQDETGRRTTLLASVLDSVLTSLDGGSRPGATVLVSDASETRLLWLAAISYSLGPHDVTDLSFVTFSRDPDRAATAVNVVGTTTEAWNDAGRPGRAFMLDVLAPAGGRPASAYARMIASCWDENALHLVDRIIQLGAALAGRPGDIHVGRRNEREGLSGVLQLAYGRLLTVDEDQIASFISHRGEQFPPWLWSDLSELADIPTPIALLLCEKARDAEPTEAAAQLLARCVARALDEPGRRALLRPVGGLSQEARVMLARVLANHLPRTRDLDDLVSCLVIADMYAADMDQVAVQLTVQSLTESGRGNLLNALTSAPSHQEPITRGIAIGLEHCSKAMRDRAMSPELCQRLAACSWADDLWSMAPHVGSRALASETSSRPSLRHDATKKLGSLSASAVITSSALAYGLGLIWEKGITIGECLRLLDPATSGLRPAVPKEVVNLASVAWTRFGVLGPGAQLLADRVLATYPGPSAGPVAADAELVRLAARLAGSEAKLLSEMAREIEWHRRVASGQIVRQVLDCLIVTIGSIHRKRLRIAAAQGCADPIREVAAWPPDERAVPTAQALLLLIGPPPAAAGSQAGPPARNS